MENNCYITLMTNEFFLPCVKRCAQTIKYFNSKYPYIVMIPKNNEYLKQELIKNNIEYKIIDIEYFQPDRYNSYPNIMFNKFQLLNLTEYDKIFFLDADIILNGNMDNEFDHIKEDETFHLYSETFQTNTWIIGCAYIARPNPEFYKTIFSEKEIYNNDEETLEKYFSNQKGKNKLPSQIIHFGGFSKPWYPSVSNFSFLKSFFNEMPDNEFYYWLKNYQQFNGVLKMWGNQYNFPRNYAYSTIIKNEEELNNSINLNLKLKQTGHFFPLIIILLENNIDFIKKINQYDIPFYIINDPKYSNKQLNIIDKYNINNIVFQKDYSAICFFDNPNIILKDKNIDYIFNIHLDKNIYQDFIKQYNQDLIIIKYR